MCTNILRLKRVTKFKTQHWKKKIRKERYWRVRAILKTKLNSANRIKAINTLAIPVVAYSFNIINWTMPEIRRLDAKICKLLACCRMHHWNADVDRPNITRNEGGRGIIELELSYKTSTIGKQKYLTKTTDWMLQLVFANNKKRFTLYINKVTSLVKN